MKWKLFKKNKNIPLQQSGQSLHITNVMEFKQSGSFRGFRRYRLTIYEEPGVEEGIRHFKNGDAYIFPRGIPITLVFKEATSYKVMEVYVDNYKVGVKYSSSDAYYEIISKPFDKVHVRIDSFENIIYQNGIERRPIVHFFVHYIEQ